MTATRGAELRRTFAAMLSILIFLAVFLALLSLIEWGAWRSFRRMANSTNNSKLLRRMWWTVTSVLGLWLIVYTFKWNVWREDCAGCFMAFHGVLLTFLVPKLFMAVTELIASLQHGVRALMKPKADRAKMGRRTFITTVGQGVAGAMFASFAYGMLRGRYNFTTRRVEVPIEGLPPGLDGFKIVQISDMHLGSFLGYNEHVEAGLQLVRDLDPDLLCLTGDLVNVHADEADPWIESFKTLSGRHGKFAVLGNHDYGDYGEFTDEEKVNIGRDVRQKYTSMGFDLLLNRHVEIERGGEKFTLVGVENWGRHFRRAGDLDAALEGADPSRPTVLMSHDPTHWEEKVMGEKAPVDLTLSGHTHGMQMGLEIASLGIKFSPSRLTYRYWGGLYRVGKQQLYVNRGFGYLGVPGRIGMPPEVTELILRTAPRTA